MSFFLEFVSLEISSQMCCLLYQICNHIMVLSSSPTSQYLKLLGIIDIKELLQADNKAFLKDIMNKNIISLKKEISIGEATKMFTRYGFRSLPVIDEDNKIVGIVSQRDIMKLTLHLSLIHISEP